MSTVYTDLLTSLREAYDRGADERESGGGLKTPWKVAERAGFLERVRAEGGRTLVELGAGTGQDSLFFKEQGLDVVAIDLSPRMIEHCRAKGLDARVADFLDLDLPRASFDAVYALNSLLHVPNADLGAVLESIRAVMRPGALLLVGVYGGRSSEAPLPDDTHVPPRFFALRTDDELTRMVETHFEVVDFHTVPLRTDDFYFQSITLRRPR
jgi:SAM-dependent methyltransferase